MVVDPSLFTVNAAADWANTWPVLVFLFGFLHILE